MELDDREIQKLIDDLSAHDKPTIRAAVDRLISLAADSTRLRDRLDGLLSAPGRSQRWPLAYVLAHLSRPSPRALDTLFDTLDHPEPDIRWAVALLLTRVAKTDGSIVARLAAVSAQGTPAQKRMALYCIRDLTLSDRESLATLLRALDDPDAGVRVAAAISLRARRDMDAAGKAALLRVYKNDGEARVRHTAAIALAHAGEPEEEFISELRRNSEGENGESRKAALAALALLKK